MINKLKGGPPPPPPPTPHLHLIIIFLFSYFLIMTLWDQFKEVPPQITPSGHYYVLYYLILLLNMINKLIT